MKQGIFTIVSNDALTEVVYKMVLEGDTSAITNCGQFVDLRLHFLVNLDDSFCRFRRLHMQKLQKAQA